MKKLTALTSFLSVLISLAADQQKGYLVTRAVRSGDSSIHVEFDTDLKPPYQIQIFDFGDDLHGRLRPFGLVAYTNSVEVTCNGLSKGTNVILRVFTPGTKPKLNMIKAFEIDVHNAYSRLKVGHVDMFRNGEKKYVGIYTGQVNDRVFKFRYNKGITTFTIPREEDIQGGIYTYRFSFDTATGKFVVQEALSALENCSSFVNVK